MTDRTGPRDRAGRKRSRGSEYQTAIVRRAIGSETLPVGGIRADDRATIDEISSLCVPFRLCPAERLPVFRFGRRRRRFASAASGRYVQPKSIASEFDREFRCRVQRYVRCNGVAYGVRPALSQRRRAPQTERNTSNCEGRATIPGFLQGAAYPANYGPDRARHTTEGNTRPHPDSRFRRHPEPGSDGAELGEEMAIARYRNRFRSDRGRASGGQLSGIRRNGRPASRVL